MWINKNWLIGRMLRQKPLYRVLCTIFSFALLFALLAWGIGCFLLSGRTLFFVPRYRLVLYGIALWGFAALAFHGIVSLGKRTLPSAKNFAGNLWSIITFVVMIVTVGALCLISAISNSFIAGDISSRTEKGLVWCSSPADKSCTVYVYKTSGNVIEGMDLDVTLEVADELDTEFPVCHLKNVSSIGIVWKGNRVFEVNDRLFAVGEITDKQK